MGSNAVRNVVLVHGGFVDGSGWQGVYESLIRDGFRVRYAGSLPSGRRSRPRPGPGTCAPS
jgi:hypothetical protein